MIPLLTYRFNLMAPIAEAKAELQNCCFTAMKREFH
jgi:chorismate mutase